MKFLLKKTKGGSGNTTTIQEIAKLLELATLKKQLTNTRKDVEELKKLPKTTDLEGKLDKKFIAKNDVIDLTSAAAIEKNDKIPVGSIYFNVKTDNLRLKKKAGWVTVNME